MTLNPELHYLDHVQNTSISKQSCKFAKAMRFPQPFKTKTDFNYLPNNSHKIRSCTFGSGKRTSLSRHSVVPSPNSYNIAKFPHNNRSTSLGYSRDQAIFGSIVSEINAKSKIPPPGAYPLPSSIKDSNFTLKKRLPTQIQIKLRTKMPGPGTYEAVSINNRGRYPSSKFKNVRYIIMDGLKNDPVKKQTYVGPGTYDLFNNDSKFSDLKVEMMRQTASKPFGTDPRKGPEYRHKLFVPGPGMYNTFSTFGDNLTLRCVRSKTEY